jgi:hypothetical protein
MVSVVPDLLILTNDSAVHKGILSTGSFGPSEEQNGSKPVR